MTRVKICGITTLDDALMAAEAGADLLGLNFFKKSPRYIEPAAARELATALRAQLGAATPLLVGVFVNDIVSRISVTMEQVGLNFAQLSGDESFEMLRELRGIAFKAIRPRSKAEALDDVSYYGQFPLTNTRIPSILLDAYKAGEFGGTGQQTADEIAVAVNAVSMRLMLAGGLTPENVSERVKTVQPWGVDVASGVEGDQPGRKDAAKVKAFIEAAKAT